jgi:acetyl coenzyme A synthetase (ADP forming)-like protein
MITNPRSGIDVPSGRGRGAFIGTSRRGLRGESTQAQQDVRLKDGTVVRVRQAENDDRVGIVALLNGLTDGAIASRFPGHRGSRDTLVDGLLCGEGRFSLVGEAGGALVAQAGYAVFARETAEAGIIVAEAYRRRGLGTALLKILAQSAVASKVKAFEVTVDADNYAAIDRIREMGFPVRPEILPGAIRVVFPTSVSRAAAEAFERSDATTTVAAVKHFFRPMSIAVIGASRERESIGGELFRNLIEADFNGPVYPVNRSAAVVQSVAAYDSVLKCPGPVDLAFIVIPAASVIAAARECARKGVRALVVISSGFAETGAEGAALQQELVAVCREAGMRMIGPNCMGIINTDSSVNLNGQFAPYRAIPGRIGFWSQSGALGIAVIDLADRLGIGLSEFVSAGNRADVSGNDIVQYWESNDNIDVILLYIESFGDSRRFARLAKKVTKKKPIVAVKSGRSTAGFRATQSHTGALVAASDVTVDALFRQSGVIRTDSLDEMFDVAALLSTQPVPKGNRVAIVTNAGGAGILAADACESQGLSVPELSQLTQEKLRKFLLPIASPKNPVDMSGAATPVDYSQAIKTIAEDEGIDSLIVIFIPPLAERAEDVASAMLDAVRATGRRLTVASTFMATKGVSGELSDGTIRIPSYPFPELAVQALARVTDYGRWLGSPQGVKPNFEVRRSEATAIVARALGVGEDWLSPEDVDALLSCYGISAAKSAKGNSPAKAAIVARGLKGKVALKAIAPGLLHKTDAGGVKVGLAPEEVEDAAKEMEDRLRKEGFAVSSFMVQEMVSGAVEMFVGVTHDPTFGPLIACGAGGTLVELVRDVSVGLTPLSKQDAERMVSSLKTHQILDGYRGGPKYDAAALEETILRLGQMVEDIPEVAELDLNPLMVLKDGEGAVVVDSRIRVAEAPRSAPRSLR